MADKKKIDAKNNQILADLLNRPENRVCCECGEKGLPFSHFPFLLDEHSQKIIFLLLQTRSPLGFLEHRVLFLRRLCWYSPPSWHWHHQSEVNHSGFVDPGAD